jgi:hypothetical protein
VTLLLSIGLVLAAAGGTFLAVAASGPSYKKKGFVHLVEERGDLYTFDAAWRVETLRRIDPATHVAVPVADPARMAALRTTLLRQLKVQGLDGIPVEGRSELGQIRSLGYL